MVSKKLFHSFDEVMKVQQYASMWPHDVSLHSLDSSVTVDAKSFIGCYTLDIHQPVLVVSEDASFHNLIRNIGENVA